MCKMGLRNIVSPRFIALGFLLIVVFGMYNYIIPCLQNLRVKQLTEASEGPSIEENVESPNLLTKLKSSEVVEKCSKKVNVNVNYREKFEGLKINNELYVPFNFLKSYYEISGEFIAKSSSNDESMDKDIDDFLWLHTNKNDLDPRNMKQNPYTPFGMYLHFKDIDVANRARVKCICGKYGVPITTQWDPKGYYYPTQIAQYGLSHLSKYFGEKIKVKKFHVKLSTEISSGKFSTTLNIKELKILKITMQNEITSFFVRVIASDQNVYQLHYVNDNSLVSRNGKTIVHGLGTKLRKNEIVRDLQVDLVKGLSFCEGKKEGNTVRILIRKIKDITIDNIEYVTSVHFINVDHVAKFLSAVDWFIDFQDGGGGWKTNVSRVVFKEIRSKAGWYSAMGQGQAISLLSRVYKLTDKRKYLEAALKATKVFNVPSNKDGVLAMLFGKIPWYEEYPTTPSLYVLNGFIYSLLGLYDLTQIASGKDRLESQKLFEQGLNSLETLLPLYDNGQGSFYDLRHVSVPGYPPNRARWQYHRVHLEQLVAIVDITKSASVNRTLLRWIEYASGVPTRHN